MKCRICGTKASVNMRQHNMALCKEHYLEWVPVQTARFIKKYEMFTPEEKILVAVSGGKILYRFGIFSTGLATRRTACISVLESMRGYITRRNLNAWLKISQSSAGLNYMSSIYKKNIKKPFLLLP